MHLFVRNCELKPRVASLVIFVLLTLPCLLILGTILYYHSSICNKDENNKVCKYDFVMDSVRYDSVSNRNRRNCKCKNKKLN